MDVLISNYILLCVQTKSVEWAAVDNYINWYTLKQIQNEEKIHKKTRKHSLISKIGLPEIGCICFSNPKLVTSKYSIREYCFQFT